MIPDKILNVFNRSIKMVCSNIACYCNDPVSDFTRKRKLPAETLIHFIVQMQSKSLNSELCEYFTDLDSLPTASALCQQRDKLDISAFQRIMHLFVNAFDDYKTWKGYHVLACDGSDVNIAYDEKDEDTTAHGSGADNAFSIKNNGTEVLNYAVKSGTNAVGVNGTVLEVAAGTNTGETEMDFKLSTTTKEAEVAGNYTGTITYNSEILRPQA